MPDGLEGNRLDFFRMSQAPLDKIAGFIEHALPPLLEGFIGAQGDISHSHLPIHMGDYTRGFEAGNGETQHSTGGQEVLSVAQCMGRGAGSGFVFGYCLERLTEPAMIS